MPSEQAEKFLPQRKIVFGSRATNCIWSSCTLRAEWAVLLNLLHDNTANLDKHCQLQIAGICCTTLGEKWQRSISFCPAPSSLADSQALSIELTFQGLSRTWHFAVPQHLRNSSLNFLPQVPQPQHQTQPLKSAKKRLSSPHNINSHNSARLFSFQLISKLFCEFTRWLKWKGMLLQSFHQWVIWLNEFVEIVAHYWPCEIGEL